MAPTTRGLQKRRIRHREILKEKSRSGQFTLHTKGSVKTKENNKKREDFRNRSVGKTRRGQDRQEDFRKQTVGKTRRPPKTKPSRRLPETKRQEDPPPAEDETVRKTSG